MGASLWVRGWQVMAYYYCLDCPKCQCCSNGLGNLGNLAAAITHKGILQIIDLPPKE